MNNLKELWVLPRKLCAGNTRFILGYFIASVAVYLLLVACYPYPQIVNDSESYVYNAKNPEFGQYRPVGYAFMLRILHFISPSLQFVVVVQYLITSLAILLFLLTLRYLRLVQGIPLVILTLFFILNPYVVYMNNTIMSEALFLSLVLVWLSVVMLSSRSFNPGLFYIAILLAIALFCTRYTGLLFCVLTIICHLRIKPALRWLHVACGAAVLFWSYEAYKGRVEKDMGARCYSGFGGWQLANNALHAYPEIRTMNPELAPTDSVLFRIHQYVKLCFDSVPVEEAASTLYIWDRNGPLVQYFLAIDSSGSAAGFNRAGIAFQQYGWWLIKASPKAYFKGYVLKNIPWYLEPDHEMLQRYDISGPLHPSLFDWYHVKQDQLFAHYDFIKIIGWDGSKIYKRYLMVFFVAVLFGFLLRRRFSADQFALWLLLLFFFTSYSAGVILGAKITLRTMLPLIFFSAPMIWMAAGTLRNKPKEHIA